MNGISPALERNLYRNLFSLAFPIVLQQLLRISVDTVNSILLAASTSCK